MESWKYEIEVVVHTTERLNKRVNWIMSYLHISSNVCIKRNKSYFLFYNLTIFMKKKKEFPFHFWTIRLKRLSAVNGLTSAWRLCEWMKDQILIFFFSDHSKKTVYIVKIREEKCISCTKKMRFHQVFTWTNTKLTLA